VEVEEEGEAGAQEAGAGDGAGAHPHQEVHQGHLGGEEEAVAAVAAVAGEAAAEAAAAAKVHIPSSNGGRRLGIRRNQHTLAPLAMEHPMVQSSPQKTSMSRNQGSQRRRWVWVLRLGLWVELQLE